MCPGKENKNMLYNNNGHPRLIEEEAKTNKAELLSDQFLRSRESLTGVASGSEGQQGGKTVCTVFISCFFLAKDCPLF